jgi:hypothetical protein
VAEQTLQGLTVSWLTKFIRQQFETNPISFVPQFGADELTAKTKLTVGDRVIFAAYNKAHYIGSQGSPAFTNSWAHYGAPYANAGYLMRPDGWVELLGMIKNGTVGSSAFTLPPGWRPSTTKTLAVFSGSANSIGRVDIGSDGTVTPVSPSSNTSVSLDGLHFKVS